MEGFKDMFGQLRRSEEIRGAVIRYAGEDFVAPNHTLAWNKIMDKHGSLAPSEKEEARGFLTSRGRLVDEAEAKDIAFGAKQIDAAALADEEHALSDALSQQQADENK